MISANKLSLQLQFQLVKASLSVKNVNAHLFFGHIFHMGSRRILDNIEDTGGQDVIHYAVCHSDFAYILSKKTK